MTVLMMVPPLTALAKMAKIHLLNSQFLALLKELANALMMMLPVLALTLMMFAQRMQLFVLMDLIFEGFSRLPAQAVIHSGRFLLLFPKTCVSAQGRRNAPLMRKTLMNLLLLTCV